MKTQTLAQKLRAACAVSMLCLSSGTLLAGNITHLGDVVVGSSANFPGAENPSNVVDNNVNTKYLNFDKLNTGFTVTPAIGSSVCRGMTLVSANDAPERDPASFTLEGSNDGGTTWTPIASGAVPAFTARFQARSVTFANSTAYTKYRVTFPTVANAGSANSMQVAEVALLDAAPGDIGASFAGRNINGTVAASELAGAGTLGQKNWNTINHGDNAAGTSGALIDKDGSWTPVTLQYDANDSWNNDGPAGTPDERLMAGLIKAAGANHTDTFTFHNVPAGNYRLVLYADVNGDGVNVNFSAGGTTYYIIEGHNFRNYQQALNTTDPALGGVRDNGNFIVFDRLTPDANANLAFTMTYTGVGGDGAGLAAAQLMSVSPRVYSAAGAGSGKVRLTFNVPVSDAAGDPDNYTINGLTVTGASLDPSHTIVLLNTSAQTPRATYTVNVGTGITTRDANADPVALGTRASFQAVLPYDLSINFMGGYDGGPAPQGIGANEVAGLYATANWNNLGGNNNNTTYLNGGNFHDNDNNYTPITLQFAADEQWISGTGAATPNHKLFQGYYGFANGSQNVGSGDPAFANGDPANSAIHPVQIKNVPEGHYNLIVYTLRDESGRGEGITINNDPSTTLHVRSEGSGDFNANPAFRRGSSTNPTARDLCNYVQFDNIQPVNGTITLDARSEGFRSPVNGIQLVSTDVLPISIVRQPAETVSGDGALFTFSVDVIGSGPRTVQWYSNNVAVAGANSLVYQSVAQSSGNNSLWKVTVANGTSSVTSDEVILHVAPVPVLLSASSLDSLSKVCVRFSKPLAASATDISHYAISGGVTVNSAAFSATDPTVVILQTSPLTSGVTYTLTVSGVQDTDVPANTIFPNPSTTQFTPGGYEPVRITYRQYRNIPGGVVDNLRASPKFPNSPDYIEYNTPLMEYPQTAAKPYLNLESFGAVISGYYIAPATGNYQFGVAADDGNELWLSTTASPANKVKIAGFNDWTDERNYITRSDGAAIPASAISGLIPLVAGNVYYIEGLYKEGGGGDHIEVAVRRPGDAAFANGKTSIPLDQFAADPSGKFVFNGLVYTPGDITLTAQPADQHVVEGTTVTFNVDFTGTPPYAITWYSNDVAIPNSNTKSLSVFAAIANNGAVYHASVQNQCSAATTGNATLTVDVDTIQPTVADAGCDPVDKKIRVVFSEPVTTATATDPGNYAIDGGLTIDSVELLSDNKTALLTANDLLVPNQLYSLSVQGVIDRSISGNMMDATSVPITGCICSNNVILVEMWRGDSGPNNFQTLTNNPKFPNNADNLYFLTSPNWAQTPNAYFTAGNEENYGLRMRGYIVPSVSGNYQFSVHADDSGFLAISTDSTAANMQQLINAQGDCAACSTPQSGLVNLTAGRAYYFESLFQEGGGGDYLELRWKPPGSGTYDFIPNANLRYCYDPQHTVLTIAGLTDPTVEACRPMVLSPTYTITPGQGVISYQWMREGIDILGATSPTYTIPHVSDADNGAMFQVRVSALLREVVSDPVFLTVLPDTDIPTIVGASADLTRHHVVVSFSEDVDALSATDSTFYSVVGPSGPLTLTGANLSRGTNVVLNTFEALEEGADYTVTIQGGPIMDLCLVNQANVGDSAAFKGWVFVPCLVNFKTYEVGGGNAVSGLTGSPLYPDFPRESRYIGAIDTRIVYPDDSHEAYGGQIEGFVVPPVSGNYVFYLSSDDSSELWLNKDGPDTGDPAGAVKIQEETACCNPPSAHASAAITLNAGQRYYIKGLWKEGGGGDFMQVRAKLAADPANPDNLPPIGPEYVGIYVDPVLLPAVAPSLPTSGKLPIGSLTTRGFDLHTVQVGTNIDNLLSIAELLLAGNGGPNLATLPFSRENNIINYSIEVSSYGNIPNDKPFPGIPGSTASTDNIAMEALTYVELHAGFHCMIVNSDDGFRVTPALCAADPNNATVLGSFDGGRGSSDTPFVFYVPEDGLYPMRLIWQQGGGGANLEWVDVRPGASRVAVNGDDNIKAFSASQFMAVRSGNNLIISWNSTVDCPYRLQRTDTLQTPSSATVWTDVAGGSPATVPIGSGNAFFRLIRP